MLSKWFTGWVGASAGRGKLQMRKKNEKRPNFAFASPEAWTEMRAYHFTFIFRSFFGILVDMNDFSSSANWRRLCDSVRVFCRTMVVLSARLKGIIFHCSFSFVVEALIFRFQCLKTISVGLKQKGKLLHLLSYSVYVGVGEAFHCSYCERWYAVTKRNRAPGGLCSKRNSVWINLWF